MSDISAANVIPESFNIKGTTADVAGQIGLMCELIRTPLIVPLLRIAVYICLEMSLMLFFERLYMGIVIIRVKLFWKKPDKRYKWEPMKDDLEIGNSAFPMVLIQIPMFNEKEVYKISIGAACNLSWPADRIIIQVLDDSTDSLIKGATHHLEEVRDKALCLVVNKLYPISLISWQIEAFAKEMLVSAAKYIPSIESNDPNGAISEQEKESNMGKFSSELPFSGASSKELSASSDQLSAPQSILSLSLPQVSGAWICILPSVQSPDRKFLISVGSGPARVWDLTTSTVVASLQKGNADIFCFCKFSQTRDDNQVLYIIAMQDKGGFVLKWNTTSWTKMSSNRIVGDAVSAFDVSTDGNLLALGTIQGDILVVSSKSMRVTTLVKKTHLGIVTALAFSNDSRYLVSASMDSSARVTQMKDEKKDGSRLWIILLVILLVIAAYFVKTKELLPPHLDFVFKL